MTVGGWLDGESTSVAASPASCPPTGISSAASLSFYSFFFGRRGRSLTICSADYCPVRMRTISVFLFLFAVISFQSPCFVASEKERTLAMIKPDGISGNFMNKIKQVILQSGFIIVQELMTQLDVGNATLFYFEHSEKSFFPSLVEYITSGQVFVMVIEKINAVSEWRTMIGPTDARKAKVSHPNSIRAMCGSTLERNCVHGSDSPLSAAREISFFFGEISSGDVEHDEL